MVNGLKLSILIPTLNAGRQWAQLLESIEKQSIKVTEKIIIDSGSGDGTVDTAITYGFEVHSIKKEAFNHGRVRQDLVNLTAESIDICIFLTQDAILASPDSLKNLVSAFQDQQVGMAYGRQLPHVNAKPLEAHLRLFNYPNASEVLSIADIDRKGFKVFFCSNSFAAYRKSDLNKVGGFPANSIMGEDAIVAAKMLEAGFKKAYVADATVHHSHNYKVNEEFKRYFDTRVFHEQNHWLIEKYGRPTGEGFKYVKSELRYIAGADPRRIFHVMAATGGKLLGYTLGKFYKSMPGFLLRNLSMHKSYWV
jgi:rhamnosyltransferase